MGIFGQLFRSKPNTDLIEKIANGAILLDVRSRTEFALGHASGAINIPLDTLPNKVKSLKKETPIVAVCASGARSGSAVDYLQKLGYDAHNGGSWTNFNR